MKYKVRLIHKKCYSLTCEWLVHVYLWSKACLPMIKAIPLWQVKFELDCTLILSYRSTKAKMCFPICYYYWLVTQFSLRSWVTTSLTQLMWVHVPTITSNVKFPSHLPKQDSTIMFACLSCTNWKIGHTSHIGWSFVWGDKWLKLLIMNKIMNICWSLNHEMCG
jgi:hypothetical protein